jgi:glycosyltransferase involved in cell wall biosynthesis
MKREVLIWCSDISGVGGQSLVTKHVVSLLSNSSVKLICYKRYFNVLDIYQYAYALIAFVSSFFKKNRVVYLVNSRSILGFLRDLPIYIIVSCTNCKVVIHSHGSDLCKLLTGYPILSHLARFYLSKHTVVVPSQHVKDALNKILPKIIVIENFTDVELEEVKKSKVFNDKIKNKIIITWNSNIIYSKGFFLVIDFVEHLIDAGFLIEFRVFGKPMGCEFMSKSECERKLNRYTQKSWFKYFGQVTREDIITALVESDVVALPSFYSSECQPLALIDAMVLGKFLIVSDTPAIVATYGDYPGVVCLTVNRPSRINDFFELCDGFLKDSDAAAERACKRFSKSRFDRNMVQVIYGD